MNTSDCDCVVLCGGFGKRLQGAVKDVPKVLADVGGRPFLDLVIDYLKGQGISRVILCTGFKAEAIEDHYRSRDAGVEIEFSREDEPLGTGGAVSLARGKIRSDPFLVINGDSFLPADLKGFLEFHAAKHAVVTIMVTRVHKGQDYGNILTDDDGRVTEFKEKVAGAADPVVNAGMYCFSRAAIDRMPKAKKFSLEYDLFPALVGAGLFGHYVDELFMDIGTPERYRLARATFNKGNQQ